MAASLNIITPATGRIETILRSTRHIEAPNWMPDGDALLVNAEGRLFRVPLASPDLHPVATNGWEQLNNDHAPSPDGRWLGFCDKTETGKSCIYLRAATGGPTRRLTAQVPSWLHGWTPDSRHLLYTCVREGHFGIARCALETGAETLLIGGEGHYDGPDSTPDGRWIWFNSDRSGAMALWRMRRDGTAAEQMTNGQRVDWFAHPSPDGKQVCYLSYPAGTQGHPAGRDVQLRIMSAAGGAPRILAEIHGGQGSLNVPSWSPDGTRFAFVSYDKAKNTPV